ncbi:DNA gyrase inhibitor YacG [Hyphococcus sp.]|uniref:DNA gyrase inhibitor YacG n=1 Tax=Hyphococcus sp. TaxID=2038636 RepID=UPI003CCC0D4F
MTSPSNDNAARPQKTMQCPICNKGSVSDYAPFCSKRCADVDLHRWLSGGYAIPAQEDDSDGAVENEE